MHSISTPQPPPSQEKSFTLGNQAHRLHTPPDWQRKSSPKNLTEEEKAKGREATARPPNSETPKSQKETRRDG